MQLQLNPSVKDSQIAALAALAIGIHVLESILPSPLPGIKPGFANIITLIAYARFGLAAAAWVSALRVLVGSLIIGSFLSPTFILSMSGALASISVLWLINQSYLSQSFINQSFVVRERINEKCSKNKLNNESSIKKTMKIEISLLGIAVLMAMAHMATQFVVVYTLFIPHNALIHILPIMLTAALVFGVLNGMIATKVNEKLKAEC